MATTLLGIDLGSYSVKVARLEAGFRSISLVSLHEAKLAETLPPASTTSVASLLQPEGLSSSGQLPASALSAPLSGLHLEDAAQSPAEGMPAAAAGLSSSESNPLADASPRDTLLRRQMRALDSLLDEIKPKGESSAIGFSEEVTLRLLELPLSDPKKVQQTLPFELSGQLLSDLDEQMVGETLVRTHPPVPGGGEPGSLWVAACVPKHEVRLHLRALLTRRLDPRICGAIALSPAALFAGLVNRPRDKAASAVEGEPAPPRLPAWVIDFGHRYTHVCAVAPHQSRPGQVVVPFVRSILRGGLQLTQAVARAHAVSLAIAETLKHETGLDEAADKKTALAVREALRPLLRELRQTLGAYIAHQGQRPQAFYLCGGGSELRGLCELLQQEFEIETMPLVPPPQAPWFGHRESQKALNLSTSMSIDSAALHRTRMPAFTLLRRFTTCAPAVGLALSLFQAVPQVNFRKGELAFRTDYAFLREKAPYLVAFVVTLFLCIGGWVMASLHVAEKESERLRLRLISETTALFGEPRTDGESVSAELQSALREDKSGDKRIPQASALDLLDDVSHAAPTGSGQNSGNLDVLDLHIRAKKLDIKATAASAQYVEDFAAALAKLSCVKNVQKGKVLTVKNTGPDGKSTDVKQFSLELTTTCP